MYSTSRHVCDHIMSIIYVFVRHQESTWLYNLRGPDIIWYGSCVIWFWYGYNFIDHLERPEVHTLMHWKKMSAFLVRDKYSWNVRGALGFQESPQPWTCKILMSSGDLGGPDALSVRWYEFQFVIILMGMLEVSVFHASILLKLVFRDHHH
jgi:hypothetical protein